MRCSRKSGTPTFGMNQTAYSSVLTWQQGALLSARQHMGVCVFCPVETGVHLYLCGTQILAAEQSVKPHRPAVAHSST